jgi:hypothetical protein
MVSMWALRRSTTRQVVDQWARSVARDGTLVAGVGRAGGPEMQVPRVVLASPSLPAASDAALVQAWVGDFGGAVGAALMSCGHPLIITPSLQQ